ncbi:ArgE/DapE family deacylase [Latilactobacillus graminis]|uniref:Succinyl-diaminopimelate desuccinylase n=2 Tax=Latilactobacillus graminis TaxID=60519 RepID=A0AA89I182_9LACO|nr:ArgE/DapE family deacylase [Latilactobacillus graminis]KRM23642.1 succinyl-diaminopimelate desuccinylase [Latilactobacillus graminis DSM 20719]QFP80168.1 ArgE/DapE family deacylase [Latilactobacillus graminis]
MEKNEKIAILEKLVSVDTTDQAESVIADYLADLLAQHGIRSEKVTSKPGRENLVAYLGEATNKVLGVTGHMDVVSIGDRTKWTSDPFTLTARDGKLFGRGTSDMKSGLAALVIAMIELHDEQVPLSGQIKLLATVDEEKNETGAQTLTAQGYADDLTALLVAEPSGVDKQVLHNDALPFPQESIQKLLAANQTNEQHFLVFAHNGSLDFKVTATGKTAHSSMPQLGINAIDHLLTYYNRQKEYFAQAHPTDDVLGDIVPVTTLINGGEQINSVPGQAELTCRVRTTPALTPEQVIEDLNAIITELNQQPDMQLQLTVINQQASVKSDPQSPFIQLVQKIGQEKLAQAYPLMHVAGGTDAAHFTQGHASLPVAVVGPGNDSSHMIDEYVDTQMYLKHIDFFKAIMTDYLK